MKNRFVICIILIILAGVLFLPVQISDKKVFYVKAGKIYSGQVSAGNFLLNKFQPGTGLIELFEGRASFTNVKEILSLEKDEHVTTACAVNGGDKIYAIITNYNSDSKNIVECSEGNKKVIKKLEIEDNYYPLKYFDNKLYYYFFNRESDKSGIVSLDLKTGISNLVIKDYGSSSLVVENNIFLFNKKDNDITNVYCIDKNKEVKLLIEDAQYPVELNNNTILFLRNDLKTICTYNLDTQEIKTVGYNDKRRWLSAPIVLDDNYYITEKYVVSYDGFPKYTINDFYGGMQSFPSSIELIF